MRDSVRPDDRYLELFRVNLRGVPAHEREEIIREITSHFAEARAQGRDVLEVIERLGPPERLARSYRAEALLLSVFMAAAPLISTSIASILIVPLLLASAVGMTLGGVATIVAGIVSFVAPGLVRVDPATPFGQILALVVGTIALGVGLLSIRGLRRYLRLAAKVLRRGLLPVS